MCVEVCKAQVRGVCVALHIVGLHVQLRRCADLRVCMGRTVHGVVLDVQRPVVRGYSPAGPDVHDKPMNARQQDKGRKPSTIASDARSRLPKPPEPTSASRN